MNKNKALGRVEGGYLKSSRKAEGGHPIIHLCWFFISCAAPKQGPLCGRRFRQHPLDTGSSGETCGCAVLLDDDRAAS